ncbi:unnamed protein product, partial [marine sediment metagenome]
MEKMDKNFGKKIGFAGCKNVTKDCIENLIEGGYRINNLITLSPEQGERFQVAGYMDLKKFADENNIGVYYPEKYSLKSEKDQKEIKKAGLDLLICMGWQRLIPKWLLEGLSIGACGMHGSSEPLPKGRGRSPMNWSLIEGKKRFLTHLFFYDERVDSGDIIGVKEFDINYFDTAETLHYKNRICLNRLLLQHLPKILDKTIEVTSQSKEGATYYPKRTPKDGIINWKETTENIYNLIRAVTKPFPGAFSFLG